MGGVRGGQAGPKTSRVPRPAPRAPRPAPLPPFLFPSPRAAAPTPVRLCLTPRVLTRRVAGVAPGGRVGGGARGYR